MFSVVVLSLCPSLSLTIPICSNDNFPLISEPIKVDIFNPIRLTIDNCSIILKLFFKKNGGNQ